MNRRITSVLAASALGVAGLVAASAPAAAQQPVKCPTHAGVFTGSPLAAHDDIKKRGTQVDEHWVGNVAVVDYRIDGRYERFATNGWQISRECYNQKPQPPKDAEQTSPKPTGGGIGGSGGAPGYGGFGMSVLWSPGTINTGKVTVGPVENVS